MAKVGDSAHTPHGLGKITESVTERGRKSFRVAGRGFSVWVDETKLRVASEGPLFSMPMEPIRQQAEDESIFGPAGYPGGGYGGGHTAGLETTIEIGPVNEKNHTTLPWDYTPQYDYDLFRDDQNIQPGDHEIDPDKRLRPSDSVSGKSRSDSKGPGPSPELFEGGNDDHPFADQRTSALHVYAEDFTAGQHSSEGPDFENFEGKHFVEMGPEEYASYGHQDDSGRSSGGRHEKFVEGAAGHLYDQEEPNYWDGQAAGWAADDAIGTSDDPRSPFGHNRPRGTREHNFEHQGNFYRPAGLDKRYAHFEIDADIDNDSPVAQFRRDPRAFIGSVGHLWTDGDDSLEHRFAAYTHLVDHEASQAGGLQHTSAWRDVRQKASRLRNAGAVEVHDAGPNRLYATVQGDNGVYDVMIHKAGAFGGNQSVLDWACSCDWGRWAFKRKFSYVGRLCSHAYAAYLGFQKNPKKAATGVSDYKSWLDDNSQAPEASSVANYLNTQGNDADKDDVEKLYDHISDNPDEVPERDYKAPYTSDPDEAYKTSAMEHAPSFRTKPFGEHPGEHDDRGEPDEWWSANDHAEKHRQADILRQKPLSLSPNLRAVPEPGDNEWVDVTKDDRETTGPDQIMRDAHRLAMYLHGDYTTDPGGTSGGASPSMESPAAAPSSGSAGMTTPDMGTGLGDAGMGIMGSHHYAESSDEALLEKLRNMTVEDSDYGHMDEHNDEVRDVTDELNDRGYDASLMVAHFRQSAEEETPSDGNGDFLGQSAPGFPDQGYAGSGPDPKDWISDSAGYVKENEEPNYEDLTDGDGDIIKYDDANKPPQGPRHTSNLAYLHYAADEPGTGYENPNNPSGADWDEASGAQFAQDLQDTAGDVSDGLDPSKMLDGAGGGGGKAAGEAGAGEAGAAEGLLSKAPMLLAHQKQGGFSLEAFDNGEFSFDDAPGGGELRRVSGLGRAHRAPRIDAGARNGTIPGQRPVERTAAEQGIPEDFGFDGGLEKSAYLQEDPSGADIVAAFHNSGAADAIKTGSAPTQGSSDDFASSPMVQAMLRTAGRVYPESEQRLLEGEFHPQGARNMPTEEDLAGTHYLAGL